MALKDAWLDFTEAFQDECDRLEAEGGDAAQLAQALTHIMDKAEHTGIADAMEEMEDDALPADVLERLKGWGFI